MIISDIDALQRVVKINASIEFYVLEPYLNDALDIYIVPHTGQELADLASAATDSDLTLRFSRALGPLAMALATDELGIQYGDGGITVTNTDSRSPANDSKILAARQNLFFRGMQQLDLLLRWLEDNADSYPQYAEHRSKTADGCMVHDARGVEQDGLIDISLSVLTYRMMVPMMRQLQESVLRPLLGDTLMSRLIAGDSLSTIEGTLHQLCVRYLCNRCAELLTSQQSRTERQGSGHEPEYRPVLRPLYNDITDTGNWFGHQAAYWLQLLGQTLDENAKELGRDTAAQLDYNRRDSRIFTNIV